MEVGKGCRAEQKSGFLDPGAPQQSADRHEEGT